ncbi:uncharacterized protein Pyn_00329 [Prunus yedoensis var. nudiflora]|uniref:Uncharacterized protein n=1 Tax=Prunus yedoensis var. nudiflora TaxID=2094558 RepID=A0A314XY74_PRUYE|nr:uncharacterized protein Pyn_00329 [Prunus yedoensis var. nudiflora]
MPFWIVIDEIWDNHLHNPLHGAAYYLNPSLFYSKDFNGDPEVSFALLYSLVQMVQHYQTQVLISRQFGKYRLAKGSFQEGRDRNRGRNIPPGVKTGIVAEEIDPMDDWIIDEAPDIEPQTSVSWMNLDYTRGAINEEGLPRTRAKTESM